VVIKKGIVKVVDRASIITLSTALDLIIIKIYVLYRNVTRDMYSLTLPLLVDLYPNLRISNRINNKKKTVNYKSIKFF
jgi:hypothetical protein